MVGQRGTVGLLIVLHLAPCHHTILALHTLVGGTQCQHGQRVIDTGLAKLLGASETCLIALREAIFRGCRRADAIVEEHS